tara:strand:+ start:395 stop:550 length:156 start_codon:yes stop_codon:yes gene_type:complete
LLIHACQVFSIVPPILRVNFSVPQYGTLKKKKKKTEREKGEGQGTGVNERE